MFVSSSSVIYGRDAGWLHDEGASFWANLHSLLFALGLTLKHASVFEWARGTGSVPGQIPIGMRCHGNPPSEYWNLKAMRGGKQSREQLQFTIQSFFPFFIMDSFSGMLRRQWNAGSILQKKSCAKH